MIKQIISKIKEAEFDADTLENNIKKEAKDLIFKAEKDLEVLYFNEINKRKNKIKEEVFLAENEIKSYKKNIKLNIEVEMKKIKDLAKKNENEAILKILHALGMSKLKSV